MVIREKCKKNEWALNITKSKKKSKLKRSAKQLIVLAKILLTQLSVFAKLRKTKQKTSTINFYFENQNWNMLELMNLDFRWRNFVEA